MVTISKDTYLDVENIFQDGEMMGYVKKLKNGYRAQALNKGSHFQPERDSAILWVLTLGQTTKTPQEAKQRDF